MLSYKMVQAINQGNANALRDLLTLIEVKGVPLDLTPIVRVEYWDSPEEKRRKWMQYMQQSHKIPLRLMEAFFAGAPEAKKAWQELIEIDSSLTIPDEVLNLREPRLCEKLISLDQYIFELFFSETTTKQQKRLIWEARDHVILDYTEEHQEMASVKYDDPTGETPGRAYNELVTVYEHIRKTIADIIEPHLEYKLGHLLN